MSSLQVAIVTFNCGRELVNPSAFGEHLFKTVFAPKSPELLILSLQEVASIAYSFLGGSFLASYFNELNNAVHLAARSADGDILYVPLLTRNLGMTALMSFVREDRATRTRILATGGVGVGVHEMGNKGAVGLRLGYETEDGLLQLTFVAAHLAPMEWASQRRNQDWQDICQGLVFTPAAKGSSPAALPPASRAGEEDRPLLRNQGSEQMSSLYALASHVFLAGDLNYRTSRFKPSLSDHTVFPQPTSDSASSRHYVQLLKEDQLSREREAGRTCHGFKEAPVNFPPTYKYSNLARATIGRDEGEKWLWAKQRWPSWCDRILYLEKGSSKIEVSKYTALPLMATSDHRAVAATFSIPLKSVQTLDDEEASDPPFALDPRWAERRAVARKKEIIVGLLAYLSLTWEGRGIVAAVVIGALGGWAIVQRSLGGEFDSKHEAPVRMDSRRMARNDLERRWISSAAGSKAKHKFEICHKSSRFQHDERNYNRLQLVTCVQRTADLNVSSQATCLATMASQSRLRAQLRHDRLFLITLLENMKQNSRLESQLLTLNCLTQPEPTKNCLDGEEIGRQKMQRESEQSLENLDATIGRLFQPSFLYMRGSGRFFTRQYYDSSCV